MKLIAIILAAVSMAFSAPGNCAHALGLAQANQDAASVDADLTDHSAHQNMPGDDHSIHAMHSSHEDDSAAQKQVNQEASHSGCTDDCTGGANCDGCAMASAAIVSVEHIGRSLHVPLNRIFVAHLGIERVAKIDTPPPRRIEA